MGTITLPYTFIAGQTPTATNWNANPTTIATLVNGQLDKANVDSSSTDGIVTMDETQSITGAKTFSGAVINTGGVTIKDTDNAAGSIQTNLTLEWDPGDGAQMTDNSSGVGIDFKMPDASDNQTVFASLDVLCIDDSASSEDGEFSFKTVVNASEAEVLTLSGAAATFTVPVIVGIDGTGHDVKFFGDTSGKYMQWDQDEDALLVSGDIRMIAHNNRIDLDANNNTSIRASADDTIMFELAGADDFSMTANSLNILSGSVIDLADNAPVQFGDADDASIKWDASNLAVSAGTAAVNITAGDLTLYDDNNGADVSLTMGTGSAESFSITVDNGGSNKTAEEVKFVTATASGTANHGKMTFNVDGTDIICVDDGGIDMLANGNQLTLDTDGDTSIRASADDQIDWKVGTGDVMKLVAAGGANPKLTLTAAATSHSSLMDFAGPANGGSVIGIAFVEGAGDGSSNNMKYQFGYLGGGNYVSLDSWNIDGSAGRADIFRVPDGQLSIDANTTWDANVFDYVCSSDECGWHDAHEVDECPLCGSGVEWHDDADLLDRALHLPAKRNGALATLERLGVVNTYGTLDSEKPEVFTSLPNAHMFTFSAVAQLHRRISELERKIA